MAASRFGLCDLKDELNAKASGSVHPSAETVLVTTQIESLGAGPMTLEARTPCLTRGGSPNDPLGIEDRSDPALLP
jgi:hypothetical protein